MSEFGDAIVSWVNQFFPPHKQVNSFQELSDGVHFFDLLSNISGDHFDPADIKRGQSNSVLRKSNLDKLLSALTQFVADVQEGKRDFNMATYVDSSAIIDGDETTLVTLAEFVFTIFITSGSREMMDKVRALAKPEQQALQAAAKKTMTTHALKKAPVTGGVHHARSTSTPVAEQQAVSSPSTGNVRVFGASNSDPTTLLEENKKLNEQLSTTSAQLAEAHAAHEELLQRHKQLEGKYKKMMDEGTVGQSVKERELYDKLDAKDRTIRELEDNAKLAERKIEQLAKELDAGRDTRDNQAKEIASLQDSLAEERRLKLEAIDEIAMHKDRSSVNIKRREELEEEVDRVVQEKKTLEEKLNQKRSEVESRDSQIKSLTDSLTQLKSEIDSQREKIAELEAADGLAHNFAKKDDFSATSASVLREELEEIRNARNSEKAEYEKKLTQLENSSKHLQAQLDAAEANIVRQLEKAKEEGREEVRHSEVAALQQKCDSLLEHLQKATAATAQKGASPRASRASTSTEGMSDDQLRAENERLKEGLRSAKSAARLEQAAIFSAFFECGHRSLQVQQRQMVGAPPIPTATLFDASDTGAPISFLEKNRRAMEQQMLSNLAGAVQTPPRQSR